ncbi:hypothetical protein [Glutamicibacter ardleyensis]|uniref:Uncharacterized protein n=1 Tax=Glutamicibacter ardleyensis TaxID=225894 RepID=A0ABQ2DFD7_9MICC|nr:hypothetical protein [Glutamicibacter ardleyensis]GGJ56094.1 hypothetical protein GCM10007173_13640 [Glutamicibacter ardleyensis]
MSENGLHRIPLMKTVLEQITALHEPRFIGTESDGTPRYACLQCFEGACKTYKLLTDADLAGGDRG